MIRETSELKSQDRSQSGMTVSVWTLSAAFQGHTVTAWAVIGLARMVGLFVALALMSTVTQTFAQNPPARESAGVTGASKGTGNVMSGPIGKNGQCLVSTTKGALAWGPCTSYRTDGVVLLNNLTTTPGKIRTTDEKQVCHGGSTKQYRHTTATQKKQVYIWYGAKKKPGWCCEVDHLIPLELGGADDVANLWPQPYLPKPGAHEKDKVENWLHAQVCSGKMPLTEAQKEIAEDWYKVYLAMPKDKQ